MSHWNYRIIKVDGSFYGLYEVYYAADGKTLARTDEPVFVRETPEELVSTLETMLSDAKKNLDPATIIDDATTEWPGL